MAKTSGHREIASEMRVGFRKAVNRWASELVKDGEGKARYAGLGSRRGGLADVEAMQILWCELLRDDVATAIREFGRFIPQELLLEDVDSAPGVFSHQPLDEAAWIEQYGHGDGTTH